MRKLEFYLYNVEISGFYAELLEITMGNMSKLEINRDQSVNQPRNNKHTMKIRINFTAMHHRLDGGEASRRWLLTADLYPPPPTSFFPIYIGHAWPSSKRVGQRVEFQERIEKKRKMKEKRKKVIEIFQIWCDLLSSQNSVFLHFCFIFLFG